LLIIIQCLWVGKFAEIPFDDLFANCPSMIDSCLTMELEEHMNLIKLLKDRQTPSYLLMDIDASLKNNDVHRISFLLFLFQEMLYDDENAQAYSSELQLGRCKTISLNDKSDKGLHCQQLNKLS